MSLSFTVVTGTLLKKRKEWKQEAKAILLHDPVKGKIWICLLEEWEGNYTRPLEFNFKTLVKAVHPKGSAIPSRALDSAMFLYFGEWVIEPWTPVTKNVTYHPGNYVNQFRYAFKYYTPGFADRFIQYFTHMCTKVERDHSLDIKSKKILEDEDYLNKQGIEHLQPPSKKQKTEEEYDDEVSRINSMIPSPHITSKIKILKD